MPRNNFIVAAPIVFVLALVGFMVGRLTVFHLLAQQSLSVINHRHSDRHRYADQTETATPTNTTETPTGRRLYPQHATSLRTLTHANIKSESTNSARSDPDVTYISSSAAETSFQTYTFQLGNSAQMEWLVVNGYHPIRLMDLGYALASGAPLPEKPIVLTFDDGYVDFYQNALPRLKIYRLPATVFVLPQWTDENRPGYLTWSQMGEIARAGIEIGSHGPDHSDLVLVQRRSLTQLEEHVRGSKQTIELRLGIPVKTFNYPSGSYNARVIQAVQASGYLAAVITDSQGMRQTSDKPFELKRIRIQVIGISLTMHIGSTGLLVAPNKSSELLFF
jgi:peptidoglycan/xylan/chitin deacetylase (PgdA/CDA1 family)